MHCTEDEAFMECPVKPEMEQYALTSALWFQAPAPFKCGPRSKFPTTGFWDYDLGKENNKDAYANDRGRVDVENCCWWGRGYAAVLVFLLWLLLFLRHSLHLNELSHTARIRTHN